MQEVSKEQQALINAAVRAGIKAGYRKAKQKQAPTFYQLTVKRLCSLRVLEKRVDDNVQLLKDMEEHGIPQYSRDRIRLGRVGPRLDPEEKYDALKAEIEAEIESDQHEIKIIKNALKQIEDDEYYLTVYGRYVEGWTDERCAEEIHCSLSTVYKNRPRLMDKLIIIFFGAKALRQK